MRNLAKITGRMLSEVRESVYHLSERLKRAGTHKIQRLNGAGKNAKWHKTSARKKVLPCIEKYMKLEVLAKGVSFEYN